MGIAVLPAYATHYFVDGRKPFLNLSDLEPENLAPVLAALNNEHVEGRSNRTFGRHYMELRRLTETKMRDLFLAGGGVVDRESPHYFVLGECEWFASLAPGMNSLSMDLADLPSASTSVTYPDSVVAMRCGIDFGLPDVPRPYHEQVFRLEDLHGLVARYGMPNDHADDEYAGYEFREFEKFIEIQVWSDAPLQRLDHDNGMR